MRSTTMEAIRERLEQSPQYSIFVIGDSITEGYNATAPEHTYTAVFARGLSERYPTRRIVRYDGVRQTEPAPMPNTLLTYGEPITVAEGTEGKITVVRSGVGGNTVRRLLNRRYDFLGKKIEGRVADLFTLMVGINDALSEDPQKFVLPEVFDEHLNTLIDEMEKHNPDTDLILMTPTYNDFGTEHKSRLAPYAEVVRRTAERRGIPLVDQHALWMSHLVVGEKNSGQGDWLTDRPGDYCHPSNLGHEAIANELLCSLFV